MAGNARKIDEVIDQQAVDRQFGNLMEWLNKSKAMIEGMPRLFDNYKNAGGSDAKKALTEMSEGMSTVQKSTTELSLALKEHQKNLTALATAQAKSNALSSETASQLASEREALRQRTTEVKNTVAANQAAQGSIQQLRAVLSLLTTQYDKLGAAERNSAKGTELQQKIKAQSDALKKLEADTGRYSRNVGNYTGAISVLEKALTEVKGKIDNFTQSGNTNQEVLAQLEKEQTLLSQVLEKNNAGFSNLTMEVRSNERALATMYEQGMQNSEAFNALQQATAKAKRELTEFQQSEKLLSSTAPTLQASMVAAKGLAGTYAIGAGAAALFADGNEKVEKELNKLVAIMTILQGLNEVHELLEKRLAIAKIFSAAGTGIQTAALKLYTWATGAATAATVAFRTALISTGLGALLVLLSSFAGAMADAKSATDDETKALKDYDQALKYVNDDLEIYNKVSESNTEKEKERIKQRAGSEAEIAKATQKGLQDQVKNKKEAYDKLSQLNDELQNDKDRLAGKDDKESKEKLDKLKKEQDAILNQQDKLMMGIFEDGIKMNTEAEKEKTRISEEGRKSQKANAEAKVIDLEREQIAVKKTMTDEKASYVERLVATERFYQLQEQIENKKKKNALATPNLTPGEINKIIAENNKALAEISENRSTEEDKLFEQEKQRTLAAQLEIFKSSIERKIAFEEQMFNDDKRSSGERLAAYDEFSKNEKSLIDAEWQYKRNQSGLIQKEIEALDKEHQDKLAVIEMKGAIERKHIIESALKANLDKNGLSIELGASEASTLAIKKLTSDLKSGAIDAGEFSKKLKEIDDTAKKTSLLSMASAFERIIADMKLAHIDATKYELDLANVKKDLALMEGQREAADLDKRKEKRKETLDTIVASERLASEAIQSIIDGQHEMEINRIQDEINANTEQKDVELKNIQASTLSSQEKANQIAIINANAQANEDRLNKKKKDEQIKQAQFDKGIQEFNLGIKLIIDTVQAVSNPKKWLDVAADVTGLVALAAKPIPKYAVGVESHPGGPAIVGEVGSELVQTKDGKSFLTPGTPTFMNLPKGAKVIPHDEVNQLLANEMMQRQAMALMGSPDVVRELRTMREMQVWQTGKMVQALSDKQPTKVIVINNSDLNNYIKQQVYE